MNAVSGCRPRWSALLIAVAGLALVGAAPAGAAARSSSPGDPSGVTVTIAARSCPSYASITANRARNDIQESLQDLGADTPYSAGQAIDPTIEASSQPACTPIPNWKFTFGRGIQTRAVTGPWGALSIVTDPFSTAIQTRASTPLLNTVGQPTGKSIAGAVTIQLTNEQRDIAASGNAFWIQGGTPADPILDAPFPGEYGFGALRCAIDNLNGDNVEWIAFPQGSTHVLCYAYYVKPPPTSGTIVVRKQVQAPAGTPAEDFGFTGNISFNSDGRFVVPAAPGAPGEQTFYRAETALGADPWTFKEDVPPGWKLSGLSCTSQTNDSQAQTDLATGATAVHLAAGDLVTCTYTDTFTPPPAGLLLRKVTDGGVGTFGFTVTPQGGGATTHASATTTEEGISADAIPGPISLAAGTYDVNETLPTTDRGRWRLVQADCDGADLSGANPLQVTLASGAGAICTLYNHFRPNGSIAIHKQTVGGIGATGFVISPVHHDPPVELIQSATTRHENTPVLATGDDTSALPLGRYVIQETTPSEPVEGAWQLESIVCNGVAQPSAQGRIQVTLTVAHPALSCLYVNRFRAGALEPLPEPGPDPTPEANLSVSKTVSPATITVGGTAHYRIVVTNHGAADATQVTVTEQLQNGLSITSARPSHGSCQLGPTYPVCNLGTIKAGHSATITVNAVPQHAGTLVNRVAVGSASAEATLKTNVSRATVAVKSATAAGRAPIHGLG
jgi:uncharacterized repeat protein (TIGR01451 family)